MKIILPLNRTALSSAVLVICLLVTSTVSFAATITVTNTNDSGAGSLRQAILDAGSGDTLDFDISGTIMLSTGEMTITDDLKITGPGADIITIDAQVNSRIFNIDDGDSDNNIVVSIRGLRLIKGFVPSPFHGGAIRNAEELSIDSCVFEYNNAEFGGAITNEEGTIEQINNSTFSENSADFGGGAINSFGLTNAITNSTFTENNAMEGGAIFNNGTLGKISNSYFTGNTASQGGVIQNLGVMEQITNSKFTENSVDFDGGAIFNDNTIKIITNSTFTENSSTGGAGGAIATEGILIEIASSTFNGNSAPAAGAIFNATDRTIGAITNSTFDMNEATIGNGGAIVNDEGADISISFTTIVNNTANGQGGGIFENSEESIDIRNSIAAFNTAGDPDTNNCNEDIATDTSEVNNYSNDDSCGFNFDDATIQLGPLADNGGSTKTLALISGDPINGASADCDAINDPEVSVTQDQRGFDRPFPAGGTCDAGAYETQPTGKLTIVKETDPPGGMDFEFLGTGFPDGCVLMDMFSLSDTDSLSCILPLGIYTVEEPMLAPGAGVNINCTETPSAQTLTGVTINIAVGDDVTCTFANDTRPLILGPIFPGVASNPNIIEVEQATANGRVAYAWSFIAGSTIVSGPTCNGVELGLKNPRLLGFRQAGANQIANFVLYIPLNPALQNPVLMQAVDIPTCRTSDVVTNIILSE